jgi:DNA-binding NarL/FixJ family response regulator
LVASSWSLLDELDTDGQRIVGAIDNGPPTRTPRGALRKREHQVLTQAHLGHSNKVIAYELHRAARKLGVSSRADAIARFDKIVHPDDVES